MAKISLFNRVKPLKIHKNQTLSSLTDYAESVINKHRHSQIMVINMNFINVKNMERKL